MTERLNEYQDYPKWINTLSDEERHQWYLVAKERVKLLDAADENTQRLVKAIATYEQNKIGSNEN